MYRIQKKKKIISLCKEAIIAGIKEEMEVEDNIPKKKRKWIRDWVARRGEYVPIYKEVETEDRTKFFGDFRMFPDEFDQLLTRYFYMQALLAFRCATCGVLCKAPFTRAICKKLASLLRTRMPAS
jgi:hypothetical protein